MRWLLVVCFSLIYAHVVSANCECTDCPEQLNPGIGGGVISQIQVSGATNPTIGTNGQGIRSVRVHLIHASLEEIDVILAIPGTAFQFSRLIEQSGSSSPDTVTLDVCFINCAEVAEPDPGFPSTFDSGAGYGPNQIYDGSYFPSQGANGCFDNTFNGVSVNNTWELSISGSPTFGGTLVDWEIDFYDNDGTQCQEFCITSSCLANAGEIDPLQFTFCEGSPDLFLNIPVDFDGNEPNPNLYDYYFVITDEDDVIIEIDEDADLTSFDPGTYNVCGLSVLDSDFPLIPTPDGSFSLEDLSDDIDDGLYCADLTDDCWQIIIEPDVSDPQITGPDTVCVNEPVVFTLEGLPVDDWTSGTVSGPFVNLDFDLPEISVEWAPGPDIRSVCYSFSNQCTSGTVCIDVFIEQPPDIVISGPLNVCEGDTYTYELDPPAPPGATWDINLSGGTLVSQSDDDFEVTWFENGGVNNAVVTLIGGPCGDSPPSDISINLISTDPPAISVPLELCVDGTGTASADFDPLINDYIWSGTGISILSGQGTDGPVTFSADELGMVEICLEVETSCGVSAPVCESIDVLEPPEPSIDNILPQCDFEFTLSANIAPGSSGTWTQTAGPGGGNIQTPNEPMTDVSVIESGLYTFEFVEDNGLCEGTAETVVEILPSPIVEEGDLNCAGGEYQIELIISGGSEPYSVDGVEIPGTEFESPTFQSGDPYSFVVSDDNGCETIAEGQIDCPCVSDAGGMSQDLLEACISTGETVTASSDGNTVFDINDIGVFVFHDLPGEDIGVVWDENSTGEFAFQSGMIPGETYYISFVVGTELNGTYDPDDPCLSVAAGQPVVFYDDPEIEILPVDPICDLAILEVLVSPDVTEVFWSNISGPGMANIISPGEETTDVELDQPGTYVFELDASNPACTVTEQVEVEVLDPILIGNLETNCLSLLEFTASFSIAGGDGNYTVNPPGTLDGDDFTTEVLDPDQSYTFSVEDNSGCTTEISIGPVDCLCDNEAGSMSQDLLNACISLDETVEAVYNGDGVLLPGDISTFILHDNSGPDVGIVFDTNEDGVFGFVPGMIPGEVYYISHVVGEELNGTYDPDDPCLQIAPGQPVIFYEDPEFELIFDGEVCGFESIFEVAPGSTADFPVWEAISWPGAEPPFVSDPTALFTPVEVFESGNYLFVLQIENPACVARDTFEVEFLENPSISPPDIECISADLFEVSFEVSVSGDSIDIDLPGTLDEQMFTSEFLEDGITYEFTVTDAAGCEEVFSIGPVDCSCISNPGTMGSDTLFFCETGGEVVLDFEDDGNTALLDTAFFVIHQGSGANLVDPFFFTDQLTFELPDTLEAGTTYFVSHVVTVTDEDGQPDLESSCLRVSQGQPLFIFELPQFTIAGNLPTCTGPLELSIENGGGGSLNLLDNNTAGAVDFSVDGSAILVEAESFGNVTLEYTEINGLCQLTDTLEIEFLERPAFSNLSVECTGEEFVVSFEATGGQSPYLLNGDTLDGSLFTGDTVPSGSQLEFVLIDAQNCVSDTLFITEDCDCESEAGTIENAQIELCEGEDLLTDDLDTNGINVPEDYVLIYLLLEDTDVIPANIVSQTAGPAFEWSSELETDETYYIVAVVSTLDGGEVNLDDPCLSVSNIVPVIWNALPGVTLSGFAEICLDDEAEMILEVDGPLPMVVTLENDLGEQLEVTVENSPQQIVISGETEGEQTWEIVSTDSDCPAAFDGDFNLSVQAPVDFQIFPPAEICNNSLFGSSLDLNELLDVQTDGFWSLDGEEIEDGLIDFDGFDEGEYILEFSTEGLEDPCPGRTETVAIQVIECLCPEVDLPNVLDVCANSASIDLTDFTGESPAGNWTVENPENNETTPDILDNILTLDSTLEGSFELVFRLTDSLPEDCPTEWSMILEVEGLISAGTVVDLPVFCEGQEQSVELENLLSGASEGGEWFDEDGNTTESIIDFDALTVGSNFFTYRVTGDLCPDAENNVEIVVSEQPVVALLTEDPLCFEDENGEIIAVVENPGNDPYQMLIDGQPQSNLVVTGLSAGVYQIQIEDDSGCLSEELEVELQEPENYFVSLGDDLDADPGEILLIEAGTNVPDSLIQSVDWTEDEEVIATADLSLSYEVVSNAVLAIQLTTDRGCVLQDFIDITIREQNVYLPNVFRPTSAISLNEAFGPLGMDGVMRVNSFQVFDRWGNTVHQITDISPENPNIFWDGKIQDRTAAEGVYVYQLIYTDLTGREEVKAGDVLLIR